MGGGDAASFHAMTRKERRMAIAKDVLDILASGRFRPMHADYCIITPRRRATAFDPMRRVENPPEAFFKTKRWNCAGCAKGAMFMARMKQGRHYRYFTAGNEACVDPLSEEFPAKELDNIETAYEVIDDEDNAQVPPWLRKYMAFGLRFKAGRWEGR